jgi:hypothetical protein
MDGPASFPRVSIPASYHQMITNAFRQQVPYGRGGGLSASHIQQVMRQVYRQFPIGSFRICG